MLAQTRKHCRKQERCDRRDHTHPQLTVQWLAFGMGHVGELLGLAQHADGLVGDPFAQGSEAHDPPRPLDQGHANARFELAQAGGQGRLGDEAGFRGPAEMRVLAQSDQILQLLEGRKVSAHRVSRLNVTF